MNKEEKKIITKTDNMPSFVHRDGMLADKEKQFAAEANVTREMLKEIRIEDIRD